MRQRETRRRGNDGQALGATKEGREGRRTERAVGHFINLRLRDQVRQGLGKKRVWRLQMNIKRQGDKRIDTKQKKTKGYIEGECLLLGKRAKKGQRRVGAKGLRSRRLGKRNQVYLKETDAFCPTGKIMERGVRWTKSWQYSKNHRKTLLKLEGEGGSETKDLGRESCTARKRREKFPATREEFPS